MDDRDTPTIATNLNATLIAYYFITNNASGGRHDLGTMKLQSLIYLSQSYYLAATGSRLIDDDFEAYKQGPAAATVGPLFRESSPFCKHRQYSHLAPPDLPENIRAFLDQIWDTLGHLTDAELRNLPHQHDRGADYCDRDCGCDTHQLTIPDESITTHFRYRIRPEDQIDHPTIIIIDDRDDGVDDDEWVQNALTALGR